MSICFHFSEPYDELRLSLRSSFNVLETDMLGPDSLRYAKYYHIYVDERETDLEIEPNFLGEGVWSDPNSAMQVKHFEQTCSLELSICTHVIMIQ